MIVRNYFGKIEPRIGNFFVGQNEHGAFSIYRNYPHYSMTDTAMFGWWFVLDYFKSMVQAYKFLKENYDLLI